MTSKTACRFIWADGIEGRLCLRMNSVLRYAWLKQYLRIVSRLGNGLLWYSILLAIPLFGGSAALPRALHLGLTALIGVVIYKLCKQKLVRERPFVTHAGIACVGEPLDRGSFPSGHTLHAACFTTMLAAYEPDTLVMSIPLSVSIALSRIALGHHYPSDVLAGCAIGVGLATISLSVAGL